VNKQIKIITPDTFVDNFIFGLPAHYQFQNSPIQLYDIKFISKYIKTPTPLFRPNFNFVVHITNGNAKQQVDTELIEMSAHSVLLIRQGHITAIQNIDKNVTGHFILFENETLNNLLSKQELTQLFSSNSFIQLTQQDSQWLTNLFELLGNEIGQVKVNLSICYSLFQAALQKILASNNGENKKLNRSGELTFSFKELLYEHHIKHKTVSFYASQLAVSENYLNRCIKQSTGKAPKELISEISILQSQLLLQDFTKQISEIAFELNYEDPSHFGRLFKNIIGITPTEYRASIMQDLSEQR